MNPERKPELLYNIALTLIPGVGPVLAKNLISYCGSSEAVFKERKSRLEKIPGIGPVTADSIIRHSSFERAEEEIIFIEKNHITALCFTEEAYPKRLLQCMDSPVMLYFRGNANLNAAKVLAVVGTRNCTDYGKETCEKIIGNLSDKNILIVSGLAYGIDISAHKSSLKNNLATIGVMAHGLDNVYPGEHRSIAAKMSEYGGLLTEYMSETNPDKENFPQRNRIVAGMSDAVLVVESDIKGGALLTAELAIGYNRDVFAIPGKPGETYSRGCNHLIKNNKAALIESAEDIEKMMGWEMQKEKKQKNIQKKLFIELKPDEKILVSFLEQNGKTDVDTLCSQSNLSMSTTLGILLNLEFSGVVKSFPGKQYQLA